MDEGLPGLVRADVGFAAPGVRANITPEQNRATEWRSPCAISIQSFLTSPARAEILGSGIRNNVAWRETSSAVAPPSWRPSSEMHDANRRRQQRVMQRRRNIPPWPSVAGTPRRCLGGNRRPPSSHYQFHLRLLIALLMAHAVLVSGLFFLRRLALHTTPTQRFAALIDVTSAATGVIMANVQ